jgi:acyl carrier protein
MRTDEAIGAKGRLGTEAVLARIWEELLGVDEVNPEVDFFALGGHSVLAVELVSKIWEHFKVEMPLDMLFAGPLTVRYIANSIEELRNGASSAESVEVIEGPRGNELMAGFAAFVAKLKSYGQ